MKSRISIIWLLFVISIFLGCAKSISIHNGNYYISSNTGNDNNSGMTSDSPWQSLIKLSEKEFLPGDSILFAKGSTYEGGFIIRSSGILEKPIVIANYGSGPDPVFSNSSSSILNGNVIQVHGKFISVEGLHFKDCSNTNSSNDKEILSVGAIYAVTGADNLTVKDCEFTNCPIGIYINSQYCLITNNYIHDCNRFLSEPDWGPIGIVIGNSYNEVSYNTCRNYVKVGGNYGADGGFLEFDDRYFGNKVHTVKVHHNISIENQGFAEIESKVTGDSLNFYYNLSDDYQQFIFYWGGNNSKVENNTVIRTRPSNNGAVNTVFAMKNGDFSLRNNIFVVGNGIQVLNTAPYDMGNYEKVVHEHNLYFCNDESTTDPCGKPLNMGEMITDPGFLSWSLCDYHLNFDSPAVDAGTNLGYTLDLENKTVPQNKLPDIGAYEKGNR